MEVFWLERAIDELRAIRTYIAERNPAAADKVAAYLFDATKRLERLPSSAPEGDYPGTRELNLSRYPYTIVYRLTSDRVEVLRVVHGKRNWRTRLR